MFCIRLHEDAKEGWKVPPLALLQRSHNKRIRLYAITFLPPGMFFKPLHHTTLHDVER